MLEQLTKPAMSNIEFESLEKEFIEKVKTLIDKI